MTARQTARQTARKNPAIVVSWGSGEASLELGTRLTDENPLFKVDVIGDILADARVAYEEAMEEMYPGHRGRVQRALNRQRRMGVESLVGKTIKAAAALPNGDVAIDLGDGRVLVLGSEDSDLFVRQASSLEDVQSYSATQARGDRYTAEPTEQDLAESGLTQNNEMVARLLGIATR